MNRRLTIHIDSGPTTCASEPGKFCPWLRPTDFGHQFACGLFDHQRLHDDGEPKGWLKRLPECVDAEVESEECDND
jgi:hypothetical protein